MATNLKHGKTAKEPDGAISKTAGTDAVHERRKANPDTGDLTDPKEVWKDGETTPSADPAAEIATGGGRVADGGDLQKANPSPYSRETQADALAKQTGRNSGTAGVEKPKQ